MKTHNYCFNLNNNLVLFFLIFSTLSFFHLVDAQPHQSNSNSSSEDNHKTNNGSKISPMTVGIIVLALAFVTIIGWLFVYLKQIPGTSFYYTYTYSGKQGLDLSVINTFPTFLYSDVKELKIDEGITLECSVCLEEFHDEHQTLRFVPKCYHVFHRECIDAWLVDHTTCPVCRRNLIPDPYELTQEEPELRDSEVSASYEQVEIRVVVPEMKMRLHRLKSTGQSVVQLGEDCERFKLKLPDEPSNVASTSELLTTNVVVAV